MSSPCTPLLLVDGYNIIGSWSSLKTTRDRHGLEQARRELVENLINYTVHKGYKTRVVFDSQYQKTPGSMEHHSSHLAICFTPWTQTADTYIEKVCAGFFRGQEASHERIIVATSDRDQYLTAMGYGAEWMSVKVLTKDIESSRSQVKRKQRPNQRSRGRLLFNCLDAQSQEKLARWL
jgi:predicted RNA-binding protein with PIN domain